MTTLRTRLSCTLLPLLLAHHGAAQTFDARDIQVMRRTPEGATRLAVVVAVSEYANHSALPPLQYADKDALDLAQLLESQGFRVQRMLLDSKQSNTRKPLSAAAILGAVDDMCGRADPNDTILFFFSGHGFANKSQVSFLCPYDCKVEDLEGTALAIEAVAARMLASKAKKAVLIADACRNIPGEKSANVDPKLREFELARGIGTLFSTAPGSRSFEPTGRMLDQQKQPIENGLFSHFLLRGLRGEADGVYAETKDGFVTFREVGYWVGKQLKEFPAIQQKPYLRWDGGADDDIWLTKAPPVATTEATAGANPKPPATAPQPTPVPTPASSPPAAATPALDAVPQLGGKALRIRVLHGAGSGRATMFLADVMRKFEHLGFPPVEQIDIRRGQDLPEDARVRRYLGDESLADLDPNRAVLVLYPPTARAVVAHLREAFADPTVQFRERAATSRQRVTEGAEADSIIDVLGLPKLTASAAPLPASEPPVPQLAANQVTVRLYFHTKSGQARLALQGMRARLDGEGFGSCEPIDLDPKHGMPARQRMERFVGDRCVADLDLGRTFLVVYPPGAATVAQRLKDLFPDVRFSFQQRAATSKQQAKEGASVDNVIDWVGLPARTGQ